MTSPKRLIEYFYETLLLLRSSSFSRPLAIHQAVALWEHSRNCQTSTVTPAEPGVYLICNYQENLAPA